MAATLILFLLLPLMIWAQPSAPELIAGEMEPCGEVTKVGEKTVLHYQTFNVEKHERVLFEQPSRKSLLLCRVKGKEPSVIRGKLEANGKLLLVNPNGMMFSKTAKVHVGSLIASTLDIHTHDFLAGRLKWFLPPEAKESFIMHQGEIVAEDHAVFMAPIVVMRKDAVVRARAERPLILGGEAITLDFDGDRKISFLIEKPLQRGGFELAGTFEAQEVEVRLEVAERLVASVLHVEGATEAGKIVVENGVIKLLACGEKQGGALTLVAPEIQQEGPVHIRGGVHYIADQIKLGGSVVTDKSPITLEGAVRLVSSDAIQLKTGPLKGDVTFGGRLDADFPSRSLTVQNGNGVTWFKGDIGTDGPLKALTVMSGKVVFGGNIGGEKPGITAVLNVGKKAVFCHGSIYHTGEQAWKTGRVHFMREGTLLKTSGGAIRFGRDAALVIGPGGGFRVETGGGALELAPFESTVSQPVVIRAAQGGVYLQEIGGKVSDLRVEAGEVRLGGEISGEQIFLEARAFLGYQDGAIPTTINAGTLTLNAQHGSVGTLDAPLLVQVTGKCYVGAEKIAYLKGRCAGQNVHDYMPNIAPRKVFNDAEYNSITETGGGAQGATLTLAPSLSLSRKKPSPFLEEGMVTPTLPTLYYYTK